MLNAAQLAVFDMAGSAFELMPRDTAATGGAELAARDALGSGAQMVIGPLFAADVAAVKPVAASYHVPVLALSTDVGVAGDGTYVMGFAPLPQVERVVSFAVSRGMKSFGAILPAGPYGAVVRAAFKDSVQRHSGKILVMADVGEVAKVTDKLTSIDALFLPLDGATLKSVAGALTVAGVVPNGKPRLLGTGLWDDPDLATTVPLVAGGWYAAPEPDGRAPFEAMYRASYGQDPPRLATLAYDATALAAVLARRGEAFTTASLGNPSGFAGLDGVFRLKSDGQVERGLAILEVRDHGATVLDVAPTSFAAAAGR